MQVFSRVEVCVRMELIPFFHIIMLLYFGPSSTVDTISELKNHWLEMLKIHGFFPGSHWSCPKCTLEGLYVDSNLWDKPKWLWSGKTISPHVWRSLQELQRPFNGIGLGHCMHWVLDDIISEHFNWGKQSRGQLSAFLLARRIFTSVISNASSRKWCTSGELRHTSSKEWFE